MTKEIENPVEKALKENKELFKPASAPKKVTQIDLWNKIEALRGDLQTAVVAMKALGAQIIEGDRARSAELMDIQASMTDIRKAFINTLAKAPASAPVQNNASKFDRVKAMIANLPYADKLKVTLENNKVVVRKKGYLGANQTESDNRYKEVSNKLKAFNVKWVKGGGPNKDYRWEG